jgi:hypothetical protein
MIQRKSMSWVTSIKNPLRKSGMERPIGVCAVNFAKGGKNSLSAGTAVMPMKGETVTTKRLQRPFSLIPKAIASETYNRKKLIDPRKTPTLSHHCLLQFWKLDREVPRILRKPNHGSAL